jgi:hypothetical protein
VPLSNELKLLKNDPLSFMKACWVVPGSGYTMGTGTNAYLPLQRVFQGQVANTDSLLTITNVRDKVSYGKLNQLSAGKYDLAFLSHRQLAPGAHGDYMPMWFLPWWSDHVTKMKILQRGVLPPDVSDPDIFFTSALTGCSVFIEGPATAPTVYHGGFSNSRNFALQPRVNDPATGAEADSINHWRLLFNQYSPGAVGVTETNKAQYISGGGNWQNKTPDMQAYEQFLKAEHKEQLRIEDMTSEGTIFGLRAADGTWTFYLQESVTITLYTLRKRKRLLGKPRLVDRERLVYTRPMVVRQVYPANGGGLVAWNTTRVLA